MKLKDITDWSERWSTPVGTMDANASVADGVLVDLSLWGTSISCNRPIAEIGGLNLSHTL
jgi:hypothetical protein